MSEDKQLFESVHNYTRYKLIQMLINRLSDGKINPFCEARGKFCCFFVYTILFPMGYQL